MNLIYRINEALNEELNKNREPKSNSSTITGSSLTPIISLSVHERQQIAEILDHRSNEIATLKGDL